jgi:STE24 endopeptidase
MRLLVLSAAFCAGASYSQPADSQMPSSDQGLVLPRFDPERATRSYLAKIPPDQKARSDAYFEGGYWLALWNFLYEAAVLLLLLTTRWSARLRDLAERCVRFKPIQTIIYWAAYSVITTVLVFPLTVYEHFFREHAYGLSNQSLGAWLGDFAIEFGVTLIFVGILIALLYGVVRRIGRSWWIWGTAVSIVFLAFYLLVYPVAIAPLFNKYTRITDDRIRNPILRMARANGIEAREIYQVDASRQSKRISANVSGFLGTERISLNDNLLNRASLTEIQAVMGHEMGHYLLNHLEKALMFFALYFGAAFGWLNWAFHRAQRRWGEKWGLRGIGDTAGFPLALLVGMIFLFLTSPLLNGFIRMQESEADLFGLNASREPDGFAEVSLKLSDYRKLDPGRLEEWIFYDHPSGRVRIYTAMRWKAENFPQ